jgi:hypothetical protein
MKRAEILAAISSLVFLLILLLIVTVRFDTKETNAFFASEASVSSPDRASLERLFFGTSSMGGSDVSPLPFMEGTFSTQIGDQRMRCTGSCK